MGPTFRQLRYFIALAETGSFGAAAEAVHVSQPALSQQVKELETHLGASLVDRLPRGVQLTRAGRDVVARARRIMAEIGDMEQAVRWQRGLAGHLALGVIPTVAPYLLPGLLKRLRVSDTGLDIRIREARTDDLVEDLELGKLDAAVVALPIVGARVTSISVFEDRFVLASPQHRLADRDRAPERLRPDLIDPDQLLLLEDGHCLADQALDVCGLVSRRKVDLGASSLSTLSGLVAEGMGLTLLPEISLRAECAAAPRLRITRFDRPEPSRMIGLIHRGRECDTGWPEELAGLVLEPASELISHARRTFPP